MAQANIDALLAEIASLKESLRIKNQSLANINPNYQMNASYIAKLKDEIAVLNTSLASAEASLKSATAVPKVKPTRANTETSITGTPYDDDGNLNPGWKINEETGEPYYSGTIEPKKEIPNNSVQGTPYDDDGNLNPGWSVNENGDPVYVAPGYIDATGQTFASKPLTVNGPTGTPYDDDGNLNPGWSLNEDGDPVWVGNNSDGSVFVEPATQASAQQSREENAAATIKGLTKQAQSKATKDDTISFQKKPDWRVRLSLAPGATYLYKVGDGAAGILNPLQKTDGVIFPYTPSISVTYTAGYDSTDIVHSNYKVFQYKGSSVDNLQITGEFTAQDTNEANYMLAVIHFFRSVTKMFYGQDKNPQPGVPPPLLYLSGMGTYQYDNHPLAITNFTYSLPTDVDYIRAGSQTNQPGQNLAGQQTPVNSNSLQKLRTMLNKLIPTAPTWNNQQSLINSEATYVPTKIQIQLTAIPVVTRNDISNNFSLRDYATGELLRGSKRSGGGIW